MYAKLLLLQKNVNRGNGKFLRNMDVFACNNAHKLPHKRLISVKNDGEKAPSASEIDAGEVRMRASGFESEIGG